jgi:hypothetical protein
MTALAAQRPKVRNLIDGLLLPFEHPCAATQVFYKGAFVGLNASGFLVPMAATAGLRAAGMVDTGQAAKVDTTGLSNGDVVLKVQAAIWNAKNSAAADQITQADMLRPVFFVDDQTVAKTDGGVGRPVAGIAVMLDGGQVMVAVGFPWGVYDLTQLNGSAAGPSNLVTSGALGLTRTTRVSVTGTQAFSLANGTVVGQRKSIRCTVAASTPVGTLTPASASGFTTILFDAVGECAELEWNGTAWELVCTVGATPS